MLDSRSMKILISGLIGFVLSTLLVTVGFWKTILIIIITLLAAGIGSLLGRYNINLSVITKIFTRK
ncbi:DUF2273 domain-containing protein [Weissella hellenica]|uniref:DUF2273 domain-containing protein n=2 Tax=Weissella hellenica TaxID=46256 RepID=A0A4Y4G3J0_WEIHE|nr:DUF2273 domain-containing protein [Weissella hellenica]NKY67165.1 DUF2273 domain-containing protein [Weissella hellenica]GED36283.1 hypothetical protein WHE01_11870 [Weissella hellenica]